MKVITKYLTIYLKFWKIAFSQGTVYRADTVFLFLAVLLYLVQYYFYFGSILKALQTVGGWTLPEYTLLLATFSMNWGLFKLFYGRTMEDVIDKVFTGQYDYTLLRPINAKFLSYFCPPLIKSFPSVMFNIILLVFVINYFSIAIDIWLLFLYIIYLFIGQVIIFSFSQIAISTAFFTNDANEIYAIFENAWDQASYPGEAFTKGIFFTLSYVIPIILFASFPTRVLLGKVSNPVEFLYPIMVSIICIFVSNKFYKLGIKNYTSAGG
ncbi:MAG: ABC-2 family transporter protein [Candidatus Shapirobacteria bacterium]